MACQGNEDNYDALKGKWYAIGLSDRTVTVEFVGDKMRYEVKNFKNGRVEGLQEIEYKDNILWCHQWVLMPGEYLMTLNPIPTPHEVKWVDGNRIVIDDITYVRE